MTKVIGLTGGIGSGKSTVSRMLETLGATVIDADRITREVQAPGGAVLERIAESFGTGVLDASGALDREALGAIVFRDAEARRRLNAIVHPAVGAEMARRIEEARGAGDPLVVVDVPLLLETGRAAGFEAVVVVYCRESQQIERQIAREGYTREEALRRVRAQLSIEEKRGRADHVIDNSGSLAETERQVRELFEGLVVER
ncbi:MAG: dephospho-CoA kinase [Myxococcota bacterium]